MRILLAKFAAVIVAISAVVAVAATALAVPVGMLGDVGSGEPDSGQLELSTLAQRSYVYAADGSVMAILHDEENREPVLLADVPQHVVDAILAVEDAGFFLHDGVNARGMLRAFQANIDAGGISQGGSTITQQLVKLEILTSEQTLDRKVQEIVLALRLENELSKEEILERYLNTVYFGNHSYGVQAAAETYFGVGAAELSIDQAAMLAGMIRNPNLYNPIRYPERVKERRAVALDRMVEVGVLDEAQAGMYAETPLPAEVNPGMPPDDYFVTEVRSQLLADERLGATYEERKRTVFQGGLKVYTTYDPAAQAQAEAARDARLPLVNGVFAAGTNPDTGEAAFGSAAIVSVQPDNGAVRTMVGGPGFESYQYNLVTQNRRNPGSSFKTFVLATALEQGRSIDDQIEGKGPCTFAMPEGQAVYRVDNFEPGSGGMANLREQTLRSSNCAYVRLGFVVGQQAVVDMATKLGIRTSPMNAVPSTPLGTVDVTPLEMASAYATIANDGTYNPPYMIERVDGPDGNTIFAHQPAPEPVLDPQVARMVSSVLQANVQSGTGRSAAIRTGHPAAGKTGTHQNSTDAWFAGYSMDLSTVVWVGGLGSQFPIRLGGRGITGGSYPAQIWGDYMTAYETNRPARAFPGPAPRPGGLVLTTAPGVDLSPPPPPPPPPPGPLPGFPGLPPGVPITVPGPGPEPTPFQALNQTPGGSPPDGDNGNGNGQGGD